MSDLAASTTGDDDTRFLIDACLGDLVPFLWRSPGTYLIQNRGLRRVVIEAQAAGWQILGLDGFDVLAEGEVRPRLDQMYDSELDVNIDPVAVLDGWPIETWVYVTMRRLDG